MTNTSGDGGLYLNVEVDSVEINCLIDSGSTRSVVHPSIYKNIDASCRPMLRPYDDEIQVADGGLVETIGMVELELLLEDGKILNMNFIVCEVEAPIILGMDFLAHYEAKLDIAARELILDGNLYQCTSESEMPSIFRVTIPKAVTIPSNDLIILSHDSTATLASFWVRRES